MASELVYVTTDKYHRRIRDRPGDLVELWRKLGRFKKHKIDEFSTGPVGINELLITNVLKQSGDRLRSLDLRLVTSR